MEPDRGSLLVPHLVQGAVVRTGFGCVLQVVWAVGDVCFVDDPRPLLRCVLIG